MTARPTLMRPLQIVLPLVVLAVAGVAAYTMIVNRPPVETQTPSVEPPGVWVNEVHLETVRLSVESQGTVRPRTESQLVPEITGRVNWVAPSFANGGFFEAGDPLVRFDSFDYRQALIGARAQLSQARLRLAQEEAEAEVARREWEELGRGDPRALTLREPQLENARAAVAAAEANVDRAQRDLERAEVTAPYAGRVKSKSVDIGQFVTIGTPIATIYAVDIAEVRLPLPDDQLEYFDLPLSYRGGRSGSGPRVVLQTTFAGKTHEWRGRIVRTESEIDPATRMVHVVVEVKNPYAASADPDRPPLAVGMYVQAEIDGKTFENIVVLPREALHGRSQVLVVQNGRLYFRDIDILRATAEAIYVRSGLSPGERVAVSAVDTPTEGMQIRVTNIDPDELGSQREQPATPQPTTENRREES